jgi:SNF2 family DNA or RNA helicase
LTYQYKTKPFKHQEDIFQEHKETKSWGVLWEQGCGKTKPMIDTASYLFLDGKIDAMLVVAPNGVHRNWLTDEIPTHMPDNVLAKSKMFMYQSGKAATKKHKSGLEEILKHKGLAVLTISYNGFMTKAGKDFVWKFLRNRRCFYVLDESHYIKAPAAKRTKSIVASAKYAPYRRILTGTPVAQGPFDVYSQIKFLDEFFWHDRHLGSFAAFKQHFGVWITAKEVQEKQGYDPGYDQLVGYKNIEKLNEHLSKISHRLTKEDAGLNLPPKLYSKRYFDLLAPQQKAYDELVEEFITELGDGTFVEASLAIVRLLRLQQITCGYVGTGEENKVIKFDGPNPRLDLLEEIVEPIPHKTIIWARYTQDIDQILEMLKKIGRKPVRYDGSVSSEDRAKAKEAFQNGDATDFVGNPQAGSTGLTLHRAKTVIYYSNSFKLVDRLQSEDRAHRIGQDTSVQYIDLIANNSVDHHIVSALRGKFDIANQITGDRLKEWL